MSVSRLTRLLTALAVGSLAALVWGGTVPTLSGWTTGITSNSTDTGAAGSVAFSHSAGSGCSLGPRVSAAVVCSGSVVGTEAITNNGTLGSAALASQVRAASCGPVQLADRVTASRALLARGDVTFLAADQWSGATAITLGASSYAGSATQQIDPGPASNTSQGVGIWFKAASGQSGPLFSFGTQPTSTAGTDIRALVLNTNGTLGYRQNTSVSLATSGTSYADSTWHFAYVTAARTNLTTTFRIYVDGTQVATQVLNTTYTSTAGYWRLGYAPAALSGIAATTFVGSVSNLVVFDGGTVPAVPTTAQRASQSAFTTWAAAATDHWLLNDSGTTTFTGTLPSIGTTSPCTYVDISWTFTGPAASAVSAVRLSTFASGAAYAVAAEPAPGGTQTSTLTTTRDSTYDSYVAGLRLYVPFSYVVQTTASKWPLTFTWSAAASVVIAP